MKSIDGLLQRIDKAMAISLAGLMVILVVSVAWQVLSRYLFVVPAAWTEELARFLLIWIGMLGAAYAYRNGNHIGLDLLAAKLTASAARRLSQLVHLICLVFAVAVLVIGGGELVSMTWELRQYSAAIGLPIALVYVVIPTSGLLISLFAIHGVFSKPASGSLPDSPPSGMSGEPG